MKNSFYALITALMISSCKQEPTVFITDNFNKKYSVQIPNYFSKEEGKGWIYNVDNNLRYIKINEMSADSGSLEGVFNKLIKLRSENSETFQNAEFQERKENALNNSKSLIAFYKKNNNKNPTGYKVMSYFVFGVIQVADKFIVVESVALGGKNNQPDIEKFILSFKLINH